MEFLKPVIIIIVLENLFHFLGITIIVLRRVKLVVF